MNQKDKSQVALIKCLSYEEEELKAALQQGFDLLGGLDKFIVKDEKILLKPNFLSANISSKYTTTSHELFGAVCKLLLPYSDQLFYGDSPATQSMQQVAAKCGIAGTAQELGVQAADFRTGISVKCPPSFQNSHFTLAKGVLEADAIISLPRMKTHGLTKMTGAVKNQMGYLPGLIKASYHARMPDVNVFSRMLAELNVLKRPRLFIMDAIIAMEGNGPGNGTAKPMNLLIISDDPIAVDATACRLMNLDPTLVKTNLRGQELSLGEYAADKIEILGEKIEDHIAYDFRVHRQPKPSFLVRFMGSAGRLVMRRPYIDKKLCNHCGLCVEICPVNPKALSQQDQKSIPVYDYNKCIHCFCCQELCPQGAVKIKSPWQLWHK
ncbi:MAG: DUF362 domain-containing protein [Bacillota bacterium]|jgi:uncharacterized protein (DUF362 family)/Pyruvate/2-oxoacid:ferredoxin oxidoreductase delta subunit